ncbi:hypothetical protein Tco_0540642 [Tanacetum coccineum]
MTSSLFIGMDKDYTSSTTRAKEKSKKVIKLEEDGYCNGGNLPGAYHIGNSLHYQDLEWYEALDDSELKDEALRNKAIMEDLISDDESGNDCWKRWKSHEIYYHNYDEGECENETYEEGHELCGIKTREDLVKEISTNIDGEFTNLEILKYWSLETSRRLFNTHSCS